MNGNLKIFKKNFIPGKWKIQKKKCFNLIFFFFAESKKSDHDNKSLGGTGKYFIHN